MKRIIRLTESDLARIVKRVIKENEEHNTSTINKEKDNICNTCIEGIEGVNTIPACQRFCDKGGIKNGNARDCIMEFSSSPYAGSNDDDNSPRLQLIQCLLHRFKLKM